MALALEENRKLLTEDKDFGWLVFAGGRDGRLAEFGAGA